MSADRLRLASAVLVELAASLAQPSVATLYPGDDDLWVELDLHAPSLGLAGRLTLGAFVLFALAFELLLRLLKGGTTPRCALQVLGRLIATSIPVELVLGRVGLHNPSTELNSFPSASSWRARNLAIVA